MLAWTIYLAALILWGRQARFHALVLRLASAAWFKRSPPIAKAQGPRFVLLVPAHNEEQGLPATLRSLLALNYPSELFEILVIADNCSDGTAHAARQAGVSVLERHDSSKKSKGYALEYAIQQLRQRPASPDAVVVIDADTRVDRELLACFAGRLLAGQDWQQAYYTVSNPEDSPRTRLLTYAFALFNGSWLRGQDSLGVSCALRGNGMCFSWSGLQRCPWQAYGLAEDLEFSWQLRLQGERVYFAAETRVYGEMIVGQAAAARSQRLRWEHGRRSLSASFGVALATAPQLLGPRWLARADLLMPPLSRYVSGWLGSLLLALVWLGLRPVASYGAGALLIFLHSMSALGLLLYLSSPFVHMGLPARYGLTLLRAPFYALWKLRLLWGPKPQTWERAGRNAGEREKK